MSSHYLGFSEIGSNTTSSDQRRTCELSSKIVIGKYWYLTFSTAMMTELGATKSNCTYSAHQANNITTTLIARSISILALQSDIHASHQIGIPPQLRFICIDPNRLIDLPRSHILGYMITILMSLFQLTLAHLYCILYLSCLSQICCLFSLFRLSCLTFF